MKSGGNQRRHVEEDYINPSAPGFPIKDFGNDTPPRDFQMPDRKKDMQYI